MIGIRTRLTLTAIGVAAAALLVARGADALSCAFYVQESITLELEGVTVDGEPLTDASAYESFELHLEGSPYDGDQELGFVLFARDDDKTWRERYE